MKFASSFESSRFVFGPVGIDDATALFGAVSSKEFPSSLPLAEIKTLAQAKKWCSERVLDWQRGKSFVWTCRRSTDSEIVGQATLSPKEKHLALAYWVDPQYWGQGIATEMCQALLCHIQVSGYRGKVWAGVDTWNTRSESVLKKLSFNEIDSGNKTYKEFSIELL